MRYIFCPVERMAQKPEIPEGWLDEPRLTARTLKQWVGLSYRQVFDWGERGAYDQEDREDRSWRRFSARQVAQLALIKSLRGAGAPLVELRPLIEKLAAGELREVVERAVTEDTAFFVTDLHDTYEVCGGDELLRVVSRATREQDRTHVHVVHLRAVARVLLGLAADEGYTIQTKGLVRTPLKLDQKPTRKGGRES